ncbi:MAG: Alpha-xylosidase, partial [Myxococcaceae bacterium]|nr:Alpha-xylosidase [Myxococcaceae bacterium]
MRLRVTPLLFAFSAVVANAACGDDNGPTPHVVIHGGPASVNVTLEPFTIVIYDANGAEVLRTLGGGGPDAYGGPGATRDIGVDNVKVIPGWDGFVVQDGNWSHPSAATLVSRDDTSASFALAGDSGSMVVDISVAGAKVSIKTAVHDGAPVWNKTTLGFKLRPDEHFFGLGERFASVDHRGISMYSWAEEGALGAGEDAPRSDTNPYPNGPSMTYFPVPFFISSAGYAMHLATTYRTETH